MLPLRKFIIIAIAALVSFSSLSTNAFAAATPSQGKFDSRMRKVDYNPDNVTLIHGHYGFTTHIQFDAGEKVTDVAMGDPTAWACEVRDNHIFLKPAGPKANTNMSVLTNRRVYIFDLKAYNNNAGIAKFYLVSFQYPEEEKARAAQAEHDRLLREKLELGSQPIASNWNYYKIGHESISPTEAFDDNTFTYLRFPNNRDFPAVYREYPDGSEALLNSHIDGNTIIIHSIENRIVLRRGNQAALVFNGSYNPDGISNDTGMTVRGFKRTVKGEQLQ